MANITTQTIRVDLSTGKVIPTAYTHQNDTARTLVFDMYNGGMPYTMTGNTVKFAYKSPIVNGQYSVIAGASMASGTVSGNKVTVTLPVAYTQISGVGMLTMVITPTSGTVRPVNIRLVVQKSADGANEIAGSSDFPTELQEYADAWMEENVEPIIDDTLSVSGKAAEAKVTGERINSADSLAYWDGMTSEIAFHPAFLEDKYIRSSGQNGYIANNTAYPYSFGDATFYPAVPIKFTVEDGYTFRIFKYRDKTESEINNQTAYTEAGDYEYVPGDTIKFVRFSIKRTDNTVDYSGCCDAVSIWRIAEVNLNLDNTRYDAVATNADLNTYTTPCQMRFSSAAITRTVTNKPKAFTGTGSLIVLNTHNDNHVYQFILANNWTKVWMRHIMISTETYDEWVLINDVSIENSGFSWTNKNFIVHSPDEENVMLDILEQHLNIILDSTTKYNAVNPTTGEQYIKASNVYALWDSLQQQYPEYIDAGETIGYSLDTSGNNYHAVKAYYIHARTSISYGESATQQYIPYSDTPTTQKYMYDPDVPTMYLVAGTHGNERLTTWILFEIFRRAFTSGTIYSDLLTGVRFRVIPCLDCWSFDHNVRYLAAAYDSNGNPKEDAVDGGGEVLDIYDANRMCICDTSNPSYSGLQIPAYATEAKALTDYVQNCGFGSNPHDCFIDLHHCAYSLGYLSTSKTDIAQLFCMNMDELAKDWAKYSTYANGKQVKYYDSTPSSDYVRGKILAREPSEYSFAWFFGTAYNVFSSNTLETQQSDGGNCTTFAIARCMDMVYRWMKKLHEKIKVY